MRSEIRLAGFGGQGIALAGYVIGKAASLFDGRNAVLVQSYGPESRGGASSADVVVDDEPIDYPGVTHPDCLVLLSEEAAHRFLVDPSAHRFVLADADLVPSLAAAPGVLRIPATRIAEELGQRILANMVMLGFLTSLSGVVSEEAMEQAIRTSVPRGSVERNLAAFSAGQRRGEQARDSGAANARDALHPAARAGTRLLVPGRPSDE